MTTFAGLPVEGEINRYTEGAKEQHDPQILVDALHALLGTPGVEAIRWEQYTPYFNDGEPCVFSIYEARVKTTDSNPDGGDYEDGFLSTYDLFDEVTYNRSLPWGDPNRAQYTYSDPEQERLHKALQHFNELVSSGHHYAILQDKFGDPAQVTVTRDEFTVEHYDHD